MSTALVVRTQRHKKIGDSSSPMVYTLKRKPQDAKIFDLARIAQDIEALGAMSAEDVEHVGKAIVRQMRQTLTDGNSVRLDGFGIFHTTFKCRATELAMYYLPGIAQQTAVNRLNEWIRTAPGLEQRLLATGMNPYCRRYTPAQVQLMINVFGEPS